MLLLLAVKGVEHGLVVGDEVIVRRGEAARVDEPLLLLWVVLLVALLGGGAEGGALLAVFVGGDVLGRDGQDGGRAAEHGAVCSDVDLWLRYLGDYWRHAFRADSTVEVEDTLRKMRASVWLLF